MRALFSFLSVATKLKQQKCPIIRRVEAANGMAEIGHAVCCFLLWRHGFKNLQRAALSRLFKGALHSYPCLWHPLLGTCFKEMEKAAPRRLTKNSALTAALTLFSESIEGRQAAVPLNISALTALFTGGFR